MKKISSRQVTAAVTAVLLASGSIAAGSGSPVKAEDSGAKVLYSFDFEDGNFEGFSNRGGEDTTKLSITEEDAVSGSHSLMASGRTNDWNGPAFRLDTVCKPYTEYYISASVKGKYYTGATLSFQYDDPDGGTHYSNLVQNLSGSGWMSVKNVKVSFTEEMSNVFVYFEGGQDDMYIDDFSVAEVPVKPIEEDIISLCDAYADNFKVGTAITPSDLSSKSTMALVQKHFAGSLTAGNEMKPDSVLNHEACLAYVKENDDDTVPQISFSAAKPFLNYCSKNKIPVRIHTLVWHSQTPDWFFREGYEDDGKWVSPEKMLLRMENYIKAYFETLTKLYPDINFYACDVVNEAWTEAGTPRDPGEQGSGGSAKSAWVKVFGDNSFIESAFTFARQYAPEGCKLYYNDYNEYMPDKMNAIASMAGEFKKKGILDGVGLQSHLDVRTRIEEAFPTVNVYNKALDVYAALGVDIQITELDVTCNEQSPDFETQAKYYKGIWDSILAHRDSISAVVLWGITDDASWRAERKPLLFDENYKAKPAFFAITDGMTAPERPVVSEPSVTEPAVTEPSVTEPSVTEPEPTYPSETGPNSPVIPGSRVMGDVNGDGTTDLTDLSIMSLYLIGDAKIEESRMKYSDVDHDGRVALTDLATLRQFLSKVISSLD